MIRPSMRQKKCYASQGGTMPEEVVKQKGLFRRFISDGIFEVRKSENGKRTLSFSASSEQPVDRWYGTEVLSHEKGAVRMERANGGAMPLLVNHDVHDPIGMITGASLKSGRLMVESDQFQTDRAAEVQKWIDGGLRNVSIGYRVHTIEEDVKTGSFTVTDWEPYEVSIVTVPADPTVGIGRNESEYDVRMIRASLTADKPAITRESTMPEIKEVEPVAKEVKVSGVEAEKERRQACLNLGTSNRIDPRVVDRWIAEGTPLTQVASEILDVMEERGKQKPLEAARLGLSNSESKRYSLFNAIRYLKFRTPELREKAAFELECSQAVAKRIDRGMTSNLLVPSEVLERPLPEEAVKRTMTTIPGSKGGYLVNVQNMGFIDILRNRSVAMAMGSRVLSGLQGNVTFARQT